MQSPAPNVSNTITCLYVTAFLIPEDDCCIKDMIEYALDTAPSTADFTNHTVQLEPVIISVRREDNAYNIARKGQLMQLFVHARFA